MPGTTGTRAVTAPHPHALPAWPRIPLPSLPAGPPPAPWRAIRCRFPAALPAMLQRHGPASARSRVQLLALLGSRREETAQGPAAGATCPGGGVGFGTASGTRGLEQHCCLRACFVPSSSSPALLTPHPPLPSVRPQQLPSLECPPSPPLSPFPSPEQAAACLCASVSPLFAVVPAGCEHSPLAQLTEMTSALSTAMSRRMLFAACTKPRCSVGCGGCVAVVLPPPAPLLWALMAFRLQLAGRTYPVPHATSAITTQCENWCTGRPGCGILSGTVPSGTYSHGASPTATLTPPLCSSIAMFMPCPCSPHYRAHSTSTLTPHPYPPHGHAHPTSALMLQPHSPHAHPMAVLTPTRAHPTAPTLPLRHQREIFGEVPMRGSGCAGELRASSQQQQPHLKTPVAKYVKLA